MVILLFLAIAAGCVAVDVPALKKLKRRDWLVCSICWLMGIGATACTLYKINVPSPLLPIIYIYQPINRLFESWFY